MSSKGKSISHEDIFPYLVLLGCQKKYFSRLYGEGMPANYGCIKEESLVYVLFRPQKNIFRESVLRRA